ncbi:MAG: DUF4255 domain-containing protein [Nitrosomonas sp.]|nr:DUF4255 domain-containing protein [Nitrosomonas sp.]
MASYRGVSGFLLALESFLANRLPEALSSGPTNAQARLLGSADIAHNLSGNLLGIYLHRITIDPHGRQRTFSKQGGDQNPHQSELPVNLHFLLISNAASATIEADLMSWAMVELANEPQLDVSHIQDIDDEWGQTEILNITPDEMTTEDLMRIWDVFNTPFTSTVPYVARTVRLRLKQPQSEGPPVSTRIFPSGSL